MIKNKSPDYLLLKNFQFKTNKTLKTKTDAFYINKNLNILLSSWVVQGKLKKKLKNIAKIIPLLIKNFINFKTEIEAEIKKIKDIMLPVKLIKNINIKLSLGNLIYLRIYNLLKIKDISQPESRKIIKLYLKILLNTKDKIVEFENNNIDNILKYLRGNLNFLQKIYYEQKNN